MLQDRAQYKHQLDFVQIGDLAHQGVFDEAVKGVDAIIHTASVSPDYKCNQLKCIMTMSVARPA